METLAEKTQAVTIRKEEKKLPHLLSQLCSVIDAIESSSEKEQWQELLNIAHEELRFAQMENWYRFILDNWYDLCDKFCTYRLLADLAKIEEWRDIWDASMRLLNTLKSIGKTKEV